MTQILHIELQPPIALPLVDLDLKDDVDPLSLAQFGSPLPLLEGYGVKDWPAGAFIHH
jgi:hypothetical protein